jgi:hypothetical protein
VVGDTPLRLVYNCYYCTALPLTVNNIQAALLELGLSTQVSLSMLLFTPCAPGTLLFSQELCTFIWLPLSVKKIAKQPSWIWISGHGADSVPQSYHTFSGNCPLSLLPLTVNDVQAAVMKLGFSP